MELTYTMTGDDEVRRRLLQSGDRMRTLVSSAIYGLALEAQSIAQSRAPVGGKYPNKYGHGNIPLGVKVYAPGATNIPRAWANRGAGEVFAVVASTWFTGRFFEGGADVIKRPMFNQRKFRSVYKSTMKRAMKSGLTKAEASDLGRVYAQTKSGQRVGKARRYFTPVRQFMAPARDAIASRFTHTIQEAVMEAIRG